MGLLAMLGLSCNTKVKGNGKRSSDYVKRAVPAGKLIGFNYVHSGTMAQPFKEYDLQLLDNGKVQLYAHDLDKYHDTILVGAEVLDTVARMIIDNDIYRYKDHFDPGVQVYDGEGWRYSALYDDNTHLSSGGTNAWPRHFALPIIAAYLDSIAVKGGALNKLTEYW